jgi:hypothetical protein
MDSCDEHRNDGIEGMCQSSAVVISNILAAVTPVLVTGVHAAPLPHEDSARQVAS